MMTVDERAERLALRQLPKPIDARAIRSEILNQTKHRQQESEDDYC